MNLSEYVIQNTIRGDCTCGKCIDAPENNKQPSGHTVNLTFFKVAKKDGANPETFLALVKSEFPHWLDGAEHSYLEVGGDIGDQGVALMCIGLGDLLGVWKALSPDTLMPFLDDATKKQMAGTGMVALNADKRPFKEKVAELKDNNN